MKNVILIGTGQMAIDYFNVLKDQECNIMVIGRGKNSALNFQIETGLVPITGGIDNFIQNNQLPFQSHVVIATGTESLMSSLLVVLKAGAHKVLIEKPAALSIEELIENEENLNLFSNRIFVAYNRRFYSSVINAKKLIEEDGGLKTIHFEFTEWAHLIEPLDKHKNVKENWFFANSSHVVDLAFYFAGKPDKWIGYSIEGNLKWHSKTNFTGAGITQKGVLFSYISNWESAGRWSIELLTDKRRIILKPLEKIIIQNRGSIESNYYEIDDIFDVKYKPGLYNQVYAFLNNNQDELLSINNHLDMAKNVYSKMLK
jgi:predicted dehydrogenase